ncbi:stalk domain-containing protein [Paenibacillus silviterrae]|uniref:stalk domain-containing protein n=1 Tax=Paenibacillus silviterrae TaxID=3242194 RepID=UPI002543F93E|nr:stalk domain-containing protein [Paenibacillus chinjuensis]
MSAFRRYASVVTIATLLFSSQLPAPSASANESEPVAPVSVQINGTLQAYEQPPIILNGSTLVPLRGIFEALGATVIWDGSTRTVSGFKDTTRVILGINKNEAEINGKAVQLEQPAVLISGNTLVPARFVSESLGAQVAWDEATRTVRITTKPQGSSADAFAKASHQLPLTINGMEDYKLPSPLPAIRTNVGTPHTFKAKQSWKSFSTKYFDIYYFAQEEDVLRMSTRFDLIQQFLLERFGVRPFGERIPVYFQDEENYTHESRLSFGHARWNTNEKAMFIQLTEDTSIDRVLATFKHELTHAMTFSHPESKLDASTFLGEAAATYYEQAEPHPNFVRHSVLYEAYKGNRLLPFASIPDNNQEWKKEQISLIYAQSQSFYTYLVESYGETKINNLWFVRGEWKDVIKQVTGKSAEQLEQDWKNSLKGRFEQNKAYRGVLFYDDGAKYIGELRNGLPHGQGKQFFNGRLRYEGGFADDKYHGTGTYYHDEGAKYVGEWKNGEQEGRGKAYANDGALIYEGDFVKGNFNGQGTYYYQGGQKYVGQFKDDKPNGIGTVYSASGEVLFSGTFKDGDPVR